MGYLGEKWYIMWKFGEKLGNLEKNWKFLHYLEKNWVFGKKIGNLKTQKFGEKKFGKLEDLVFWRKKSEIWKQF